MAESSTKITIGSSSSAMLQIEGEGLASTHAVIYGVYEEEFKKTYAYIDTVEGNTISINGGSLQNFSERKLRDGDIISFGKKRVKVTYLPDPDISDQVSPFELTVLD